jgi:hypothetical protein
MATIDNKVDLRLECARLALNSGKKDYIKVAKKLEEYIQGDSNLPETSNPNELLEKVLDLCKTTSQPITDFISQKESEKETDNKMAYGFIGC